MIRDDDLGELAKRINAATVEAEAHARSAVEAALRAGTLLVQAKRHVQHGQWEVWLQANCTVAPRTARAYMALATKLPQLPANDRQRVADLPLRDAIKAISTSPETPPRRGCADYRAADRDDAERAVDALKKSASALRNAARDVDLFRALKGRKLAALRDRLAKTLALIDGLAEEPGA